MSLRGLLGQDFKQQFFSLRILRWVLPFSALYLPKTQPGALLHPGSSRGGHSLCDSTDLSSSPCYKNGKFPMHCICTVLGKILYMPFEGGRRARRKSVVLIWTSEWFGLCPVAFHNEPSGKFCFTPGEKVQGACSITRGFCLWKRKVGLVPLSYSGPD